MGDSDGGGAIAMAMGDGGEKATQWNCCHLLMHHPLVCPGWLLHHLAVSTASQCAGSLSPHLSLCHPLVCSPRLSYHPSSHHRLSRHWLAITLPLVVPPTCLFRLVAASPLNAVTITHCHCPTVDCAVAEVAHCNRATIINSLCVDIWPLLPIAAADNMAITVMHCRIPPLSCCTSQRRRHCRPSQLCCCTYWHKHCCVTPCCATKSLCAGR
jgi:hypothetical protein